MSCSPHKFIYLSVLTGTIVHKRIVELLLVFGGAAAMLALFELSEETQFKSAKDYSASPQGDRCVPLFHEAKNLNTAGGKIRKLYRYRSDYADLRVCSTTLTTSNVTEIVGESRTDLLAFVAGDGCDRETIAERSIVSPGAPLTQVSDVLNITPTPDGWTWNYDVFPGGGPCSLTFTYFPSHGECPPDATAVVPFRIRPNHFVRGFTFFALALAGGIIVMQTSILVNLNGEHQPDTHPNRIAFAQQGPIYLVVLALGALLRNNKGAEVPTLPSLPVSLSLFAFLIFDDVITIVALSLNVRGCSWNLYMQVYITICLKILKIMANLIAFFWKRAGCDRAVHADEPVEFVGNVVQFYDVVA